MSLNEVSAPELRKSVCPLDCPDRCSLEVTVSGEKVVSISGSHLSPLTDGFICTKVGRFGRRLYGAERVLYPLRRIGEKGSGRFERIGWDEAVAEISARFRDIVACDGGEAILPLSYGGSNGLLSHGFVDEYFFRRLGSSRISRTVCAASTTAAADAMYGRMPGTAFEDYARSRFILIWGANPLQSNIHLVPHLKEARRRGARIAVVDPRRILGRELVDIFLQPYPGTDVVVALAMIRHLEKSGLADRDFLESRTTGWRELLAQAESWTLERAAVVARIKPEEIAQLAEAYAEGCPAVVRCGWGPERNRNGLASIAAILALPAVAGKFGVRGAGYTLSNSRAYQVDDQALAGLPAPSTRLLNMSRLGRWLEEAERPRIRGLFVYNCNPAATLPDHNRLIRGLAREDLFAVVFEQAMTDTAMFADIVLPATTFLEHAELNKSYGSYALQYAAPVVEPQAEARSNAEVFQLLGRAMGWSDEIFFLDGSALLRRAAAAVHGPFEAEPDAGRLERDRIIHFDFPGRRPVQFQTVHPATPDGKVSLYPKSLGENPYSYIEDPATAELPLALISPASGKSISSTLAEFNLLDVKIEMHPADAWSRGLEEGARVRIFNNLGEVHCRLRLDARLKPGVVSLPKGIWRRATLNGAVGNTLVPDEVTPVSGGACFNDARVDVAGLD